MTICKKAAHGLTQDKCLRSHFSRCVLEKIHRRTLLIVKMAKNTQFMDLCNLWMPQIGKKIAAKRTKIIEKRQFFPGHSLPFLTFFDWSNGLEGDNFSYWPPTYPPNQPVTEIHSENISFYREYSWY